jgi:hypothetical protein
MTLNSPHSFVATKKAFNLPDNLSIMPPSTPADPARINVQSTIEVNYWCQTLNCTETRLRNAIHAVGPLSADVRAYLSR